MHNTFMFTPQERKYLLSLFAERWSGILLNGQGKMDRFPASSAGTG